MRFYFSLLLFTSLALSFTGDSGKDYPQDYFRSPVSTTILLSGTFGELRPNHFHAGIDIKGKVGQALYAIADGYVSRIKVQEESYGKVLYIRHPNGYTSVYAHMHQFDRAIEDYVKKAQYNQKTFEIELYPQANTFTFKKGQVIGKMGVTGRSFGPHLHFEIRSTATEKPINPLLFGLKVADNRPPRMHQIKVYQLNDKRETLYTQTLNLVKKGNGYGIKGDTLNIPAWRAGIALKVYDHMNGVTNWNGIYALKMYKDDELFYDFDMETFAFSESRYINAHLDYEEQQFKKAYFNRCFALPGNQLSIYNHKKENGVIQLSNKKATKIKMVAEDVKGNSISLLFWVKRKEVQAPKSDIYNYILPYDEESVIKNQSLYLHFPKGALYENLYMKYQSSFDESYNTFSSVHHIHNEKTPVHKYYTLGIRPTYMTDEVKNKAFIAHCDKKNNITNYGGIWEGDLLQTKVRTLGDFCIMIDNEKPKIQPIRYQKDMRGFNKMTFKITDNISTGGNAKGLRYEAKVDGQWILMEFDAKKDLLTHHFDGQLGKGSHQLQLVVTDDRGNQAFFERSFTL